MSPKTYFKKYTNQSYLTTTQGDIKHPVCKCTNTRETTCTDLGQYQYS